MSYNVRCLKANPFLRGNTRAIACDNFYWHDTTYKFSGDYPNTLWEESTAGCDNTVTLHLTANETITTEFNDTVCSNKLPYIWNGCDCVFAGDHKYTYPRAVTGCDSLVTLHLTVNDTIATEFNDTLCDVNYMWNTTLYTYSGNYVKHFTSAVGCDSIVTLHLASLATFEYNDSTYEVTPDMSKKYREEAESTCDNLIYSGCDDWYLPSEEEIKVIWNHRNDIGGFRTDGDWFPMNSNLYWRSTLSEDGNSAWCVNFAADLPEEYGFTWGGQGVYVLWGVVALGKNINLPMVITAEVREVNMHVATCCDNVTIEDSSTVTAYEVY